MYPSIPGDYVNHRVADAVRVTITFFRRFFPILIIKLQKKLGRSASAGGYTCTKYTYCGPRVKPLPAASIDSIDSTVAAVAAVQAGSERCFKFGLRAFTVQAAAADVSQNAGIDYVSY